MAIENRAGTKTNTGYMNAGHSKFITEEGKRKHPPIMTPRGAEYHHDPSKSRAGPVAKREDARII